MICHNDYLEEVEGDLFELFQKHSQTHGRWVASALYLFNVIQFMQPFSFNSPQYYRTVSSTYIRVIFRSMKRKKAITALNVFGLALAFLISMSIFAYVSHELSYDKYHQKRDRIFRVTYRFQNEIGYDISWARMNQSWVNELPTAFPEIEKLIRLQSFRSRDIKIGNKNFRENFSFAVDKEILDVFDFEFIEGSKAQSLTPYTVVLTSSSAKKYFGDKNPIGQSMEISNDKEIKETYVVTAIIKDPPSNTHLPINLLTSINNESDRVGWAYTYIVLKEHASIQSLKEKIPDFISDHEKLSEGDKLTVVFQPLPSIHLHSHLSREITSNSDVRKIIIFVFVGLFLLAIGTINFININTIQSLDRVKEFGLRQSLGAKKGELKTYIILESMIIGSTSAILAMVIYIFGLPFYEQFIGHTLVFNFLEMVGYLIVLVVAISFLSTLVASLPMAKLHYNQISAWFSFSKGYKSTQKRILIGLQFSTVLLLCTSMVIVQRQFTFMTNKKLGYDSEQLLVLRNNNRKVMRKYESLKAEMKNIPGIYDVTAIMEVPSVPVKDQGLVTILDQPMTKASADIQIMDLNGAEVLGMEFIAGGSLPEHLRQNMDLPDSIMFDGFSTKERGYIINQAACRSLGWQNPEDAIGQHIDWTIGNISLNHGPIAGVIKDFHQETLLEEIRPLVITYEPMWVKNILVKISTDNPFTLHESLEELWENYFPNEPLELSYLSQELENLYQDEKKQLQLISIFTVVAILIAFMGLYGMMAYSIKLRLKELGIRKVLGSSWLDTTKLLSKEYIIIAVVSMCFVFPLVNWVMKIWLANYAYHVTMNGSEYLLSGAFLMILILFTLTYNIVRNGNKNPTLVLKSE